MKPSITFVVPALNEEANLEGAVEDFKAALDGRISSYEMILIDDGSADRTGQIADTIAKSNPRIRVIHHTRNMGIGYSIREGYGLATKEFVVWGPSDRGLTIESFCKMFDHLGKADILIPFIANPFFRPLSRRFLSRTYVLLLNFLFGLKLRYYNSPVVYRTKIVQSIEVSSTGFSFAAQILILAIKVGYSYLEIPTVHIARAHGKSTAISLKNLREIFRTLIQLMWKVHFEKIKEAVPS